ncbi:ABC transporter ATP-binding protein, partial [Salmonella enterica]|nr:ABC transporter ATP-binding protein [Salmonella enterica]
VLERRNADFDVRPTDRTGKRVAVMEQVEKAYGERPILRGVSGLLEYGDKIALIGRNGSGKTTLFKLLLGEEQPSAGSLEWGARVDVGYLAQQEEPSNPKLNVLEYFRLEAGVEEGEARGILARYLFYGADVFRSVGQLSGGEWTRLRLALLVQRKPNVLLLDEPTNHLDIASREALEESLVDFEGTVLAISHDRYFVNRLASRVWELENGRMITYLGDYEAYREKKLDLQARAAATNQRIAGVATPARGSAKPPQETKSAATPDTASISKKLSAVQLEQRLARLEEQIQVLDHQLESVENTPDELEQIWNERERLSGEYNEMLAQWAEL